MRNKLLVRATALVLPMGMIVALGAGTALARGHRSGPSAPVSFTGPVTCGVNGKVTFSPPLTTGGTSATSVTVVAALNKCDNNRQGGVKLNVGHLRALAGSMAANDCAALMSGTAPNLSGGTIAWSPTSKVVGSGSVSLSGGLGSTVTNGSRTNVQVSYSGGAVMTGSFAGDSPTITVTSTQTAAQVQKRCSNGLAVVKFKGTATF